MLLCCALTLLSRSKKETESIMQFSETHCKNCGALSSDPYNCSYCGTVISTRFGKRPRSGRFERAIIAEQKAVDLALSSAKVSLTKNESIELAFSSIFALNARIRDKYAYPVVVASLGIGLLYLLTTLGWISGSDYAFRIFFGLLPVLAPLIFLILTNAQPQISKVSAKNHAYVLTNSRLEIFDRRGHLYSSIWFARVQTIVEVTSDFSNSGKATVFTLLDKRIHETSLLSKAKTFRAFIGRVRYLGGTPGSSMGVQQFTKSSIILVRPENADEIREILKSAVSPHCPYYSFEISRSASEERSPTAG